MKPLLCISATLLSVSDSGDLRFELPQVGVWPFTHQAEKESMYRYTFTL